MGLYCEFSPCVLGFSGLEDPYWRVSKKIYRAPPGMTSIGAFPKKGFLLSGSLHMVFAGISTYVYIHQECKDPKIEGSKP